MHLRTLVFRRVVTALSFWALLALSTVFTCHITKAADSMAKKIQTIEGITEYRLDNGLQLLLFPDSSKPVFTVSMTVMVGSRHEGYGETGMAHLLEHMLFKGTEAHPTIPKLLKDRGANFNGTTWYDRTNYYETLTNEKDNLEFAIRLEADRLVNSRILGEDLATEMSVVRSEFESGENSPQRILPMRMMSTAYLFHNYGKSTIGNRSDIERVPVNALREFYKKYYRPDNTMLVIAGKFDPKDAIDNVNKYFGILDAPSRPVPKTYTVEPPQDGERTTVIRRVADSQFVGATYHVPAGSHPTYPAFEILAMVMADEPSGRLYKSLIETKKASSMNGGDYALHDPGVVYFLAEVPKDKPLEETRAALIETLEDLNKDPVREEEVERAKRQILKGRELRATNPNAIAIELSEWASQGDWRLYFLYRDRLEKVTAADVQQAADQFLVRNNRTVGLFIPVSEPQRIEIPESINIAASLENYEGREAVAEGEEFDPSVANIEARSKQGELSTGVQYTLLPKKTRGSTVIVQLNLRYGDEKSLFEKSVACEFLGPMMMRGTADYDFQQLKDKLDQLLANVNVETRPQLLTLKLQTKRENLGEVLKVVESILRRPTFPEKEFEVLRDESLVGTEAQISDPQVLAPTAVVRALNVYKRGDIRYTSSVPEELEDIKGLKLDEIKNVYSQMLSGSVGELSAVGDFDVDEVTSHFESILASWKTDLPYQRAATVANPGVKKPIVFIETPDKPNSMYYASQQYELRDDDPHYPALMIGNYIFGSGGLSSRLGDRIRQKEGLSYGVGSGLQAHQIDERASMTIYAIFNPFFRDKVTNSVAEEIKLLLEKGVTADEVAAAKQGYLQTLKVSRTSDSTLAQILNLNLFAGRTMKYYSSLEQSIQQLNADDVNEALLKFIEPDSFVIVAAGDFANAKDPALDAKESQPSPSGK